MSTEKIPSPRDRILNVAGSLFYKEGYRAVGIDRIIAESNVAKATFYKYFPAKDDLIVAWIEAAEKMANENLPGLDVPDPLFAYADRLIDIAKSPRCMGCTYQGTASEFVDVSHPAHAKSIRIKQRVIAALALRAIRQNVPDANDVANNIFLFLEGVWASVRMLRGAAPLAGAKAAVRKLAS
jgi:AcrR family transcriptional regulator